MALDEHTLASKQHEAHLLARLDGLDRGIADTVAAVLDGDGTS